METGYEADGKNSFTEARRSRGETSAVVRLPPSMENLPVDHVSDLDRHINTTNIQLLEALEVADLPMNPERMKTSAVHVLNLEGGWSQDTAAGDAEQIFKKNTERDDICGEAVEYMSLKLGTHTFPHAEPELQSFGQNSPSQPDESVTSAKEVSFDPDTRFVSASADEVKKKLKYILYYFDLNSHELEGIRFLLKYKHLEFSDHPVTAANWQVTQTSMPFHRLPVLKIHRYQVSESVVMARYLGFQHGLTATSPWANAKLDEAVDVVIKLTNSVPRWIDEHDVEKKESIRDEIVSQTLLPMFDKFVSLTGISDSKLFLNGPEPAWADFYVAGVLEYLNRSDGILSGSLPYINKPLSDYLNRVRQLDGVNQYVAKRQLAAHQQA